MKDDYDDYGWIAPDGTYFKCDAFEHIKYAEEVLKKDDRKLENEGWIKLTGDCINGRCIVSKRYLITQNQYNTLLKHGFSEKELEDDCLFIME